MFRGKSKEQERIKVGRDIQSKIKHLSLMKTVENLETVLQKGGKWNQTVALTDSLC